MTFVVFKKYIHNILYTHILVGRDHHSMVSGPRHYLQASIHNSDSLVNELPAFRPHWNVCGDSKDARKSSPQWSAVGH